MGRKGVVFAAALCLLLSNSGHIAADAPSPRRIYDQKEFEPVVLPSVAPVLVDRLHVLEVPDARIVPRLPTPQAKSIPKPGRSSGGSSITGEASYYRSWCNCNAMTDQRWRGKEVVVIGPVGSTTMVVTDAGPVPSVHRVADLNPTVFQAVCGDLSKGVCTVTIIGP